jgi:hypothetical protein
MMLVKGSVLDTQQTPLIISWFDHLGDNCGCPIKLGLLSNLVWIELGMSVEKTGKVAA